MKRWKQDDGWGQPVSITAWGRFHIVHRGPDGEIKNEFIVPNLVVTTGKIMLAGVLTGAATPFARNLAIGTATTTPLVGDTVLGAEQGTRVSAQFALTATTAYYTGIFTANNPATQQVIAEYGLLSLNAVGYLFVHSTAPAITKATGDSLQVDYQIAIT